MVSRHRRTGALLLASLALGGCRRERGDLARLRDALASGDTAAIGSTTTAAPRCAVDAGARAPEGCLAGIAGWFGSETGFHFDPPDQASAATAALVVMRDGRGEWLPAPDAWLFSVRSGRGEGADALRLAMAARMAEQAGPLGRKLASDDDARAVMRAVASSVPGACETYARLGAGADVASGPPEGTPDHSPCVQKDLERPTGPKERGRYGFGLWRGAEGALALWKEAAAALREGVALTDPRVGGTLETRVVVIGAELAKVETQPLGPPLDYPSFLRDVGAAAAHGGVDAGVPAPLPAPPTPAPTKAVPRLPVPR